MVAWGYPDLPIFSLFISGSLLGVMLAEWVWSINQTEQQK
jgi:hypothetical protein